MRPLCESHILPEFVYVDSYDERHEALAVSLERRRPGCIRKGFYEHLLCKPCEDLIGKHETYFHRVWYEQGVLPDRVGGAGLIVHGLDYASFKLFHLSVLWRASICSRPEFAPVRLGPHAATLRQQLLAGDPGPATRYLIAARALGMHGSVQWASVMTPRRVKRADRTAYVFGFAGCLWLYLVAAFPIVTYARDSLQENGELRVGYQEFEQEPFIKGFLQKLFAQLDSGANSA